MAAAADFAEAVVVLVGAVGLVWAGSGLRPFLALYVGAKAVNVALVMIGIGMLGDRITPGWEWAVGFGMTAYPIGVERGWVSRAQARGRTLATLRFFANAPMGPRHVRLVRMRAIREAFLQERAFGFRRS